MRGPRCLEAGVGLLGPRPAGRGAAAYPLVDEDGPGASTSSLVGTVRSQGL